MRKLLSTLSALVVGVAAVLVFAAPAQATTASFVQTSAWSTGYVGEITVTNNFSVPITGWEVAFLLPGTSTISSVWSAQLASTTPYYSMINVGWNGSLAPGGSAVFGFVVTGTDLPTILWPL